MYLISKNYLERLWVKTHFYDTNTEAWIAYGVPPVIDVNAVGGWLGMWSEGLGGPVDFGDGDDHVKYYEKEFVTGASDLFTVQHHGHVDGDCRLQRLCPERGRREFAERRRGAGRDVERDWVNAQR